MKLPALFGDHAVVQRDIPIPVWGWAKPNAPVRASLGASTAMTVAGADGRFLLRLPPLPAGGPYELKVAAAGESATARNVLVGEVWLASGQSNMQWTLADCGDLGKEAIREASHPDLRMLTVQRVAQIGRASDVVGAWRVATPGSAPSFSAVGYYFALRLHREMGVPVGIIDVSWGGTIVEAWTSREALIRNPTTRPWMEGYEAEVNSLDFWAGLKGETTIPGPTSVYARYCPADPGNNGEAHGWARPDFQDADWQLMDLPSAWQKAGHEGSGILWFRRELDIPAAWAGKDLLLRLGAVDKQDITYWNGEKVGATGEGFEERHWNTLREYRVPGRFVRSGRNVVAVRAYSFVFQGGMIGPADQMQVALADGSGRLPLAGNWRYRVERDFGVIQLPPLPEGPGNPNTPGILYDNLIAPLIPYGLRGAIWYQGESNVGNAHQYRQRLTDMIADWRRAWGQGDFPFLQVQLANYLGPAEHQTDSGWARLREAQLEVLEERATGMAVAIDVGEALDVHPKNKRDVGGRLAQWALAETYGRTIVPSGPLYAGMTIEGDRIRLRFAHAGKGLAARDGGELRTFFVAGQNRTFVKARAVVDGATVVVGNPDVKHPVAVRYAWADNPEGCNLVNDAGLPASPFRTDRW